MIPEKCFDGSIGRRRLSDDPFRPTDENRQPLSRGKHSGRDDVSFGGDARLFSAFSGESGIEVRRKSLRIRVSRQGEGEADSVDREGPSVARHVPVKFVVILEKAQLFRRLVGQGVGVFSFRRAGSGIADVDARPVAVFLGLPWNGCAVEQGFRDAEAHTDGSPRRILVVRRIVAINAAKDIPVLDRDRNILANRHDRVLRDGDSGAVLENAFFRRSDGCEKQWDHCRECGNDPCECASHGKWPPSGQLRS